MEKHGEERSERRGSKECAQEQRGRGGLGLVITVINQHPAPSN